MLGRRVDELLGWASWASPWDTPSPNGIGKQAICPQKGEPYLQRGFIPRARARGHARTLRARALYGMADELIHVG